MRKLNESENVVCFLVSLLALGLQLYYKETRAQVFCCEFCEISNNIFFYRTPPVAASDMCVSGGKKC